MKLIVYGWDIDDSVRHYDLSSIVSDLLCIIHRNDSENDTTNDNNKLMKKIIQESMIISMNSEMILLYLSNLQYVDVKSSVYIIPRHTRNDKIIPYHDTTTTTTSSNHYQLLHQLSSSSSSYTDTLCNGRIKWMFIHLSNNINLLIDVNNDISIVDSNGHHDKNLMRSLSSTLPRPQSSSSSSSLLSTATASCDKSSQIVRLLDCRELHNKKILKVTCSDYHFIIMCEMVCYSYGACQYGQLGIGKVT